MRLDLVTHIVAGAIGIASGFVALAVAKGARAHRRSGTVFVYAMLTMAFLGGTMALVYDKVPLYAASRQHRFSSSGRLPCSGRCAIGSGASALGATCAG